jgi:putative two-component system response regulator
MLRLISTSLEDDYKVYTLANPRAVEKFLAQTTPELFLLDCEMPGICGFDLVPIIRNHEEHKDTPIIFLTSMSTGSYVSAAAMLGACDFMAKPFDEEILKARIAKHIVRKKLF